MKLLLGLLLGVAASKPLMKLADKYVADSHKLKVARKLEDSVLGVHNHISTYIKDHS